MARPIPGEPYTVEPGDTFPSIATKAYGLSDNWPLIRNANQLIFKTDTQEDVEPGEVLFIPLDPDIIGLKNSQSDL